MDRSDLAQAAEVYRRALPMERGFEFSLTPLDRVGQPLWAVGIWGEDHIFVDGFGYGATDEGAKVSALGESAENYFASRALRRFQRTNASYNQLKAQGIEAVDPLTLCLDAGCEYSPDKVITWVPAKRYPSLQQILVPIEAAAIGFSDISSSAHDESWLMTPITNGLGAGLSLEQALSHGVLELVQRDGDSVSFRALDQGIALDLDEISNESTRALLTRLDEEGINVIAKLAEIDCGIPVIYVVGWDRDIDRPPFPLMLSACGEAADPDRERALEKALREYVSSRARKRFMHGPLKDVESVAPKAYMDRLFEDSYGGDEERALQSVTHWVEMPRKAFFDIIRDPILTVRSRVPFSSLPTHHTGFGFVQQALADDRFEILFVDFSEPESGVFAVKAIVPGFEVETMSYGRIGARNVRRLMDRGSAMVYVGDETPGALRIYLTPLQEEEFGGSAWLRPHEVERSVGKLYGLYREPNGHTIARIRESR